MKANKYISNKSGFKLPESYFKDFEIKYLDTEKHKYKTGFSVPESYFENFEVKKPSESKLIKLSDKQKTLAIAASLLVLLGTLLLGLILRPEPQQELNFSKLNKSVIESYLEDEMLMDPDLYVENEEFYFNIPIQNFSENDIIDNMDDGSLEQLIDY